VEPIVGYDHPCMSFIHIVFCCWWHSFALCIFVVVGVAYVYMCGFIVDWVRLGFICVLFCIYLCLV